LIGKVESAQKEGGRNEKPEIGKVESAQKEGGRNEKPEIGKVHLGDHAGGYTASKWLWAIPYCGAAY
jgi:hypothetical protein